MRTMMIAALASAGSLAYAAAPAQAQTTVPDVVAEVQAGEGVASYAQFRRRGYYAPAPRSYSDRYDGRYDGRRTYYRRDRGTAAAAGIAGLAAGALIGGAIAAQQAQAAPVYAVPDQNAVAYCAQRYRSYDPSSGTYLGYDGVRRSCP